MVVFMGVNIHRDMPVSRTADVSFSRLVIFSRIAKNRTLIGMGEIENIFVNNRRLS